MTFAIGCVCVSVHYTPIIYPENLHGCVHMLLYWGVIGWHICGICQQTETKTTSSVSEVHMLMLSLFSPNSLRPYDGCMFASMSRFHGLSWTPPPPPGWMSVAAWVDVTVCGDLFQCVGVRSRALPESFMCDLGWGFFFLNLFINTHLEGWGDIRRCCFTHRLRSSVILDSLRVMSHREFSFLLEFFVRTWWRANPKHEQ